MKVMSRQRAAMEGTLWGGIGLTSPFMSAEVDGRSRRTVSGWTVGQGTIEQVGVCTVLNA